MKLERVIRIKKPFSYCDIELLDENKIFLKRIDQCYFKHTYHWIKGRGGYRIAPILISIDLMDKDDNQIPLNVDLGKCTMRLIDQYTYVENKRISVLEMLIDKYGSVENLMDLIGGFPISRVDEYID